MAKFKIGDKVILKSNIVLDKLYNNITLSDQIYADLKYKIQTDGFLIINDYGSKETVVRVSTGDKNWYVGEDALELYQEDCLYKEGDTLTIGDYEGSISHDDIGYFLNLNSQSLKHFVACDKLKELFGKNVFINLALKCSAVNCNGSFPDFKSIEDLVNFVKELNKLLDSKKESDLTTIKNYQNNEIKFQRAKASCKRGVVPTGSTISGRKDKIAISIGHLSYQVCNC